VIGRQLEYLVALDHERHFGRAAQACHVTQPTLSAGLRALERELGVHLVRRGRRFESFTPEGEAVLRWARSIVAEYANLVSDVALLRDGLQGVLRIGTVPTAQPVVPRITSPFLQRHPQMRIEVRSMTSREIEDGLRAYRLDVGLTYLANEPLGDGLRRWPVYREHYRLLSRVDGPFAGRAQVAWKELTEVPLCLLTSDNQNRRILDGVFRRAGVVPPVPSVETDSLSVLLGHVRIGWASVVAQPWIDAFGVPEGMHALPLVRPAATSTIGLVASDQEPMSPLASELARLIADGPPLGPSS
jgi:DNA-binding transcriptional LysR family regulator